jgi:hypothetical protein
MSTYVTFKCDDILPSGMLCSGGFSTPLLVDVIDSSVDLDTSWDRAAAAGWTDRFNDHEDEDEGPAVLTSCPSCTRRRAVEAWG